MQDVKRYFERCQGKMEMSYSACARLALIGGIRMAGNDQIPDKSVANTWKMRYTSELIPRSSGEFSINLRPNRTMVFFLM